MNQPVINKSIIGLDQGSAVRDGEALDHAAVTQWLQQQGIALSGPPMVSQFTGGASNWTYRLQYAERDLILRRPPAGTKAKGAHDMGREYRVQSALKQAFPTVPTMVGWCQDTSVIGCEFYVMERIAGIIPRRRMPKGMTLSAVQNQQLCQNMLDQLLALHQVDIHATGLDALGKGDGYVERQISGWSKRFEQAWTDNVTRGQTVMQWLARHQPTDVANCLIHNDWRLDNLILDPHDPTHVIGVLDWEMATLGDPLMELGNLLAYWIEADDNPLFKLVQRQPSDLDGMMSRAEIVEYYLSRSHYQISDFSFYEVYGLFRLAVIVQQIYYRYHHGQTQNPQFKDFWIVTNYLFERCERIMYQARAKS
jgi:aminoglycoside phosphotransferase (APT) family kinase protein